MAQSAITPLAAGRRQRAEDGGNYGLCTKHQLVSCPLRAKHRETFSGNGRPLKGLTK
jgi:hypothetical protein